MIDIKDKMQLWGKISISQNGGQEILTRDLTIDQSNAHNLTFKFDFTIA
jgi:hypothetical protein